MDHGGGTSTGDFFERKVRFCLSELVYWDFRRYVREGSGNGHLSAQGPRWGTWRMASFTGDYKRQMKEGSGNWMSLCGSEGNLEGGIHYWEIRKPHNTCQGRLWKWSISVFIEALWGEPGGRAPIMSTPTDMKWKVLEQEHFFYRAPYGRPKALSKGGLGQYIYWTGTCIWYIFLLCIS